MFWNISFWNKTHSCFLRGDIDVKKKDKTLNITMETFFTKRIYVQYLVLKGFFSFKWMSTHQHLSKRSDIKFYFHLLWLSYWLY